MADDSFKHSLEVGLQVYINSVNGVGGQWHDACILTFENPSQGCNSSVQLEYQPRYIAQFLNEPSALISLHYPLDFYPHHSQVVPLFLQDIMSIESGNFIRSLYKSDHLHTIKGNVRIASDKSEIHKAIGLTLQEITAQESSFGNSLNTEKLSEFCFSEAGDGLYYSEPSLSDEKIKQNYWVKIMPSNSRHLDHLILEAEVGFYKIAHALGFNSIDLDDIKYMPKIEDDLFSITSLWLPRFDFHSQIINTESAETCYGIERYGIESLDALHGIVREDSGISHGEYLATLIQFWCKYGQQNDVQEMVIEYLQRDLLNVVLGSIGVNNHNTFVLKKHRELMLAPMYNLAPKILAGEHIIRTTTWVKESEKEGTFNWRDICKEASMICLNTANLTLDFELLWQELQQCAQGMREIPRLAEEFGLADEVSQHPKINLTKLDEKLKEWELI